MRLIDADVILPYARKLEGLAQKRVWDTPTNSPCYQRYRTQYTERKEFRELVENAHTVDAVPVIRCKDCKWRLNDGYCLIPKGCRQIAADEHYCSRGERWADNAE